MLAVLTLMTALCAAVEAYTVNLCSEHEKFVVDPPDEDLFLLFNATNATFGKALQGGEQEQDRPIASKTSCDWTLHPWTHLDGHATLPPLGFRQYERAAEVCFHLEKACSGITLQPCGLTPGGEQNLLYTLRTGQTPVSSTSGEFSWLKICDHPETLAETQTETQELAEDQDGCFGLTNGLVDADDQELHDVLGDLFVQGEAGQDATAAAASQRSGCSWAPHLGAYLTEYVAGLRIGFWDLERAKDVCRRLGKVCGGVTLGNCEPGKLATEGGLHLQKPIYTLRASQLPLPSGNGEHSWVKICSEADEWAIQAVEFSPKPSDMDCTEETWSELRNATMTYFESGALSLPLILSQGSVLRGATNYGWAAMMAYCAPGVLQTMLLSLQEKVFRPPSDVDYLMRQYLRALHASIGSDAISQASWSAWPLKKGWARVEKAQRDVKNAKEKSNGFSSVDIVVCFCGVSKWKYESEETIEDTLDWMVELLQAEEPHPSRPSVENLTRIFVMEKCPGEADPGVEARLKQTLGRVAGVVEVIPIEDQLRADDATAYMAHLAGPHYHDPADFTFFLHADAPEHIVPIKFLGQVIFVARSGQLDPDTFPFLNLGINYMDEIVWDPYASEAMWRKLFHSSFAPDHGSVKSYCCVQFVITKRLWHLRSQSWYQEAFDYFASAESYFDLFPVGKFVLQDDHHSRVTSQYLMPWWHVVFGEDLACPERHADPRLPLLLQSASVAVDRLE